MENGRTRPKESIPLLQQPLARKDWQNQKLWNLTQSLEQGGEWLIKRQVAEIRCESFVVFLSTELSFLSCSTVAAALG